MSAILPQRVNIGKADWIEILGTDSDEFTKAKRQINLDVISKKVSADDITPHLVASLVTSRGHLMKNVHMPIK